MRTTPARQLLVGASLLLGAADTGAPTVRRLPDATEIAREAVLQGATSDPSVVSWAPGRIDLFVRGSDNALWHKWFSGQWSGWESLGGALTSGPDAASMGPNHLDVFVRGTDGAAWHRWWNGSSWSNWESLGGQIVGDPSAVSWASGRMDLFVRGTDNALHHKWSEGQWSAWESLGGVLTSGPDAASMGPGHVDVYVRGTDGSVWHRWWSNGWSGWESVGGQIVGDPSVVAWGPGRMDLFARGTDNTLQHRWFDGQWRSWESLGGALTSGPDAASMDVNHLDIYVRGTDNGIHHKWYSGGWSNWESLGVPMTATVVLAEPAVTTATSTPPTTTSTTTSTTSTTTSTTSTATSMGVQAVATSSSSVTITWTRVSGAAGFAVGRNCSGVPPTGGCQTTSGILPAKTTSWSDAGLQPNTTYAYKVAVRYVDGRTDVASVSATTSPLTRTLSSLKTDFVQRSGQVISTTSTSTSSGATTTSSTWPLKGTVVRGPWNTGTVDGATGFTLGRITLSGAFATETEQYHYYRVDASDFLGRELNASDIWGGCSPFPIAPSKKTSRVTVSLSGIPPGSDYDIMILEVGSGRMASGTLLGTATESVTIDWAPIAVTEVRNAVPYDLCLPTSARSYEMTVKRYSGPATTMQYQLTVTMDTRLVP